MDKKEFKEGIQASIPVGVGYFSVSFGFGALAVSQGIHALQATLISLTNVTSAGQFAGLTVIATSAPLIIMILTQLVINSRYALMSLALSQRLGSNFGLIQRLIISFYNTDEIFALAMERKKALSVSFMYGLGVTPILGWTLGTLMGALAGNILPLNIRTALGVALYGMFVAIVVPQAREDYRKLIAALLAMVLSAAFCWIPFLKSVSSGLAIVICTVIAASVCALLFPVPDEEAVEVRK